MKSILLTIIILLRRAVVQFFVKNELLNKEFAQQFLNWKHSGFSVDNSVFLSANDDKGRESLCQYITRHPVSLKKITYEPFKKNVIYHTKYNEYFKENIKLFSAMDFIADLTIHIPPGMLGRAVTYSLRPAER